MEANFNVTKDGRKALVKAIGEIVGLAPVYLGAPGFKFAVGACVVDRNGVVVFNEDANEEDARSLLAELAERGFNHEGITGSVTPSAAEQTSSEESDLSVVAEPAGTDVDSEKMPISALLSGFTASSFGNLEKLVAAKFWILRKMTGADELPIERDETHLRFPWFRRGASAVEIDAYSRLIARLCETAKEKQRVTATERALEEGDNEKYKARCFLLSLGFIGKEFAQARKILLAPMNGSGSHKAEDHKNRYALIDSKAAAGGEESAVGADNHEEAELAHTAADAAEQPRCGECVHHSYFTEGPLHTAAGDIIDTSNRAPDKYTHYCVNAPSGFRKLKHAAEWSGFELAPKWCPLCYFNVQEAAVNE